MGGGEGKVVVRGGKDASVGGEKENLCPAKTKKEGPRREGPNGSHQKIPPKK